MIVQDEPCDRCDGTGRVIRRTCIKCDGTGRQISDEERDAREYERLQHKLNAKDDYQ